MLNEIEPLRYRSDRCRLTFSCLDTLRGKKQKNKNFHQLKNAAKHQLRRAMPASHQAFLYRRRDPNTAQFGYPTTASAAKGPASVNQTVHYPQVHWTPAVVVSIPYRVPTAPSPAAAVRGVPAGGRGERNWKMESESNEGGQGQWRGCIEEQSERYHQQMKEWDLSGQRGHTSYSVEKVRCGILRV